MKLRRYIGRDNQEALLKVKRDLGSEAVILNTRKVRQKGFLKFFSKPLIEVLAAVDEYSISKKTRTENIYKENSYKSENYEKKNNSKTVDIQEPDKNILKKERNFPEKEEKFNDLENKVSSMEHILSKLYEEIVVNKTSNKQEEYVGDINKEIIQKKKNTKLNELFYNNLVKNEVEPDIAKKIIEKLEEEGESSLSMNEVANRLLGTIIDMFGKPETIKVKEDGKPTVVIFIGPTGVGKTTTLAKIAADYSLNKNKDVGLITADTYRIAAVDQLKTYAEILGIPVNIVYSHSEINKAISEYKDKDIILIDTAGRSYKNKKQFEELKELVKATKADETYLVLSSTTSVKNCKEILDNYSFVDKYNIIFTKIDETPVTGVILNAICHTNRNLSYITTGQSVPDDIEIADTEKLSKNLLGSLQK
jgi:flagellar biosynthesis protein FlhF